MESEKGTDRMLVSNALLALTWNYIQPLIEKTREELEMHGEDSAADALEDLLGDEVSSGAPLPTGQSQRQRAVSPRRLILRRCASLCRWPHCPRPIVAR